MCMYSTYSVRTYVQYVQCAYVCTVRTVCIRVYVQYVQCVHMYITYSVHICVCTVHTVCLCTYVHYIQCVYMCMYCTYSVFVYVCTLHTVCVHVYVLYTYTYILLKLPCSYYYIELTDTIKVHQLVKYDDSELLHTYIEGILWSKIGTQYQQVHTYTRTYVR